jgi:hypothetical protein
MGVLLEKLLNNLEAAATARPPAAATAPDIRTGVKINLLDRLSRPAVASDSSGSTTAAAIVAGVHANATVGDGAEPCFPLRADPGLDIARAAVPAAAAAAAAKEEEQPGFARPHDLAHDAEDGTRDSGGAALVLKGVGEGEGGSFFRALKGLQGLFRRQLTTTPQAISSAVEGYYQKQAAAFATQQQQGRGLRTTPQSINSAVEAYYAKQAEALNHQHLHGRGLKTTPQSINSAVEAFYQHQAAAFQHQQQQEQEQEQGRQPGLHGRRLQTTPQSTESAVEAYYEQLARAWKREQHQQNQLRSGARPLSPPPPPQRQLQQQQKKNQKQASQQPQQIRGLRTTPQSINSAVESYYKQQEGAYKKEQQHGRKLHTPQSANSAVESYYQQQEAAFKKQHGQQQQQHGRKLHTPQSANSAVESYYQQQEAAFKKQHEQQQQQHGRKLETTPQSTATAVEAYYQQLEKAFKHQQQHKGRKLMMSLEDAPSMLEPAAPQVKPQEEQQGVSASGNDAGTVAAGDDAGTVAGVDSADMLADGAELSSVGCSKITSSSSRDADNDNSSSNSNSNRPDSSGSSSSRENSHSSSTSRIKGKARSDYKLFLYSGHDTTLMPLLAALGEDLTEWPAFASHLVLELWELRGHYYVNILYNGQQIKGMKHLGHDRPPQGGHRKGGLAGGRGLERGFSGERLGKADADKGKKLGWIPLERLRERVNEYTVSEAGYQAECRI